MRDAGTCRYAFSSRSVFANAEAFHLELLQQFDTVQIPAPLVDERREDAAEVASLFPN